jgi:hypothetical protein
MHCRQFFGLFRSVPVVSRVRESKAQLLAAAGNGGGVGAGNVGENVKSSEATWFRNLITLCSACHTAAHHG